MLTSTPDSLNTSQNSELDAKRAEYMSKYAQRTQQQQQQQPVAKSETGGFIKKRTTNVYASQQPAAKDYQTTKNFVMQTANQLLIPAKFEGKLFVKLFL